MSNQFHDSVLQVKGRTVLYLENYRKLLCYSDKQIKVLAKKGIIEINGCNLFIRYYSKEDLEITGSICSICFLE